MTILNVRFYTKPGCHLCEMAEELLEDVATECPLDVEKIDITTDVDLFNRYRYEIPVIAVEGGGSVSGRITLEDVRRVLRLRSVRPAILVPSPDAPPKGKDSAPRS